MFFTEGNVAWHPQDSARSCSDFFFLYLRKSPHLRLTLNSRIAFLLWHKDIKKKKGIYCSALNNWESRDSELVTSAIATGKIAGGYNDSASLLSSDITCFLLQPFPSSINILLWWVLIIINPNSIGQHFPYSRDVPEAVSPLRLFQDPSLHKETEKENLFQEIFLEKTALNYLFFLQHFNAVMCWGGMQGELNA